MPTECSADLFGFAPVEGREVVAAFDGGAITSDAGALLLGAADRAIKLTERLAACFHDVRRQDLIEHEVVTLVGQRVFGIALGYEDLNDHDELRHDPVMAVLVGKLAARREDCAPLAGKSTLNRLELSRLEPTRYHKISYDAAAIEGLFVELFLDAHSTAPPQITPDLDATDDPLHGHQEERFFHGLLRQLLLSAALCVLRPASIGRQIAPGQHRRQRRQRRRDGADRRPHPPALAEGTHLAACRFGFRPRGADGLVREQWRRFLVRLGQEQPARRRDRGRTRPSRRAEPTDRKAGAPLQGLHLADAQELEPRTPGRGQGGMDRRRSQSAVCCHPVSDGISMNHEGMKFSLVSRELIADSIEAVVHGLAYDGLVGFGGCDKTLPGVMMGMVRCNVPSVFMYGGAALPGRFGERDVTILDSYEAVGAVLTGAMDEATLARLERFCVPTVGACAGRFTVKTMAMVSEALGLRG